jgi:hypothetical protein
MLPNRRFCFINSPSGHPLKRSRRTDRAQDHEPAAGLLWFMHRSDSPVGFIGSESRRSIERSVSVQMETNLGDLSREPFRSTSELWPQGKPLAHNDSQDWSAAELVARSYESLGEVLRSLGNPRKRWLT